MANMLLTNCVITIVEDRFGEKDIIKANEHLLTAKPIVVLCNNNTASASEIFIGAIKENNRGIIIGEKTYGKAVIQDVFDLSYGCGMNITVRRYLTPRGNYIQGVGVNPDIYVAPSKFDMLLKSDAVLKKALSIIRKM